jgi:hypothetical protein
MGRGLQAEGGQHVSAGHKTRHDDQRLTADQGAATQPHPDEAVHVFDRQAVAGSRPAG